jgi:signal transduction histidine kinase
VAVHSIEDSGGEPVGFFAVVRDFTGRTRAERALRRSESELRLLSAQLLAAQETERRRIARGLHDGISQALGGIKFALEGCVARVTGESMQASSQNVRQLIGKVQGVIEDVGRITMDLHPSVLDHLGIGPTIDWFCRESSANYANVRFEYEVDIREAEIAPRVKTAIFRIIQESFNNAVAHGQASHVTLSLKDNRGHVELSVADNGIGFDPTQLRSADKVGRGVGLVSMRERAEATAGRFRLESRSGHGTTVRVTWPKHCPRVDRAASEATGLTAVSTGQA